jgi:hypothetical protein
MQTMQDKLTEEFRRLAEDEAGLEFVITTMSTTIRNIGKWYVMDGLDTRMTIKYDFQTDAAVFTLTGPAVRERRLTKPMVAYYDVGDHLRNVTGIVRDLLAPYAKNSGAQAPENP